MKISVMLSSYNRPKYIQQAIESVITQSHTDFELLILDDNSSFDIETLLDLYNDERIKLIKFLTSTEQRKSTLMMSQNINKGLTIATGDIISYLADDDYYFQNWFASINNFFENNHDKFVVYGKLHHEGHGYSSGIRFPTKLTTITGELDHNQVVHRKNALLKLEKPYWPEDLASFGAPDGLFFRKLFANFTFDKIDCNAATKRLHQKNLLYSQRDYEAGNDSIKIRE